MDIEQQQMNDCQESKGNTGSELITLKLNKDIEANTLCVVCVNSLSTILPKAFFEHKSPNFGKILYPSGNDLAVLYEVKNENNTPILFVLIKDEWLDDFDQLIELLNNEILKKVDKCVFIESFAKDFLAKVPELEFDDTNQQIWGKWGQAKQFTDQNTFNKQSGLEYLQSLGKNQWRSNINKSVYTLQILEDLLPIMQDVNDLFSGLKGIDCSLDEYIAKLSDKKVKNALKRLKDLSRTLYL